MSTLCQLVAKRLFCVTGNGNKLPKDTFNHLDTNKKKILLSLLYFKYIVYLVSTDIYIYIYLNHSACMYFYAFVYILNKKAGL